MIAAVQVAENRAIVRGSPPSGATIGGIARIAGFWNARAMPYANAMMNSGPTAVGFVSA